MDPELGPIRTRFRPCPAGHSQSQAVRRAPCLAHLALSSASLSALASQGLGQRVWLLWFGLWCSLGLDPSSPFCFFLLLAALKNHLLAWVVKHPYQDPGLSPLSPFRVAGQPQAPFLSLLSFPTGDLASRSASSCWFCQPPPGGQILFFPEFSKTRFKHFRKNLLSRKQMEKLT